MKMFRCLKVIEHRVVPGFWDKQMQQVRTHISGWQKGILGESGVELSDPMPKWKMHILPVQSERTAEK